ncbi:response regulator transcription factor [Nonomuraea fuscirosea]|uniref:response regulator transcription factor n=1 Tax=Nonomuraea fuscirosea TaxID=1291556 RepID=UPI00343BAF90
MEAAEPIVILIVDDHEVVRDGLIATLSAPDRRVVGAAEAGAAIELVRSERPAVAVVDLRLPGVPGNELIARLRELDPALRIVVLSTYLSEQSVRAAYEAGADAYVAKSAGTDELRGALGRVLAGESRSEAPAALVRRLRGDDEPRPRLSAQQERVLLLAAGGATDKEIAAALHITESTARFHLQRVKDLLGVRSKTQVIAEAIRLELIPPGRL